MESPVKCPSQRHNKQTCRFVFHTIPLMLSVKQGSLYTNFQVIGLTRLGNEPESTAPEADALSTRPSELLKYNS